MSLPSSGKPLSASGQPKDGLACRLCPSALAIRGRHHQLNHVAVHHLKRPLWRCLLCGYACTRLATDGIRSHHSSHKLLKEDQERQRVCLIDQQRPALEELYAEAFGGAGKARPLRTVSRPASAIKEIKADTATLPASDVGELKEDHPKPPTGDQPKLPSEEPILTPTSDNLTTLPPAELWRPLNPAPVRLTPSLCQLCPAARRSPFVGLTHQLNHVALRHLKLPLWRCRLCDYTCSRYRADGIRSHQRMRHKLDAKEQRKQRFSFRDIHSGQLEELRAKAFSASSITNSDEGNSANTKCETPKIVVSTGKQDAEIIQLEDDIHPTAKFDTPDLTLVSLNSTAAQFNFDEAQLLLPAVPDSETEFSGDEIELELEAEVSHPEDTKEEMSTASEDPSLAESGSAAEKLLDANEPGPGKEAETSQAPSTTDTQPACQNAPEVEFFLSQLPNLTAGQLASKEAASSASPPPTASITSEEASLSSSLPSGVDIESVRLHLHYLPYECHQCPASSPVAFAGLRGARQHFAFAHPGHSEEPDLKATFFRSLDKRVEEELAEQKAGKKKNYELYTSNVVHEPEDSPERGGAAELTVEAWEAASHCQLCPSDERKALIIRQQQVNHLAIRHLRRTLWRCLLCGYASTMFVTAGIRSHLLFAHKLERREQRRHKVSLRDAQWPALEKLFEEAFPRLPKLRPGTLQITEPEGDEISFANDESTMDQSNASPKPSEPGLQRTSDCQLCAVGKRRAIFERLQRLNHVAVHHLREPFWECLRCDFKCTRYQVNNIVTHQRVTHRVAVAELKTQRLSHRQRLKPQLDWLTAQAFPQSVSGGTESSGGSEQTLDGTAESLEQGSGAPQAPSQPSLEADSDFPEPLSGSIEPTAHPKYGTDASQASADVKGKVEPPMPAPVPQPRKPQSPVLPNHGRTTAQPGLEAPVAMSKPEPALKARPVQPCLEAPVAAKCQPALEASPSEALSPEPARPPTSPPPPPASAGCRLCPLSRALGTSVLRRNHVAVEHLGEALWRCRLCDFACRRFSADGIRNHLSYKHGLSPLQQKEQREDLRAKWEPDLRRLYEKAFPEAAKPIKSA